jgi:hypothetical protein
VQQLKLKSDLFQHWFDLVKLHRCHQHLMAG